MYGVIAGGEWEVTSLMIGILQRDTIESFMLLFKELLER